MITEEQKKHFKDKGFLLVPGILSNEEVTFLRKRILQIFNSQDWKISPYNTERVLSDVYNTFPEFLDITLTEKIISIIRSLLGTQPVLMPETSIHYKFYTGWHKDTTSQEKAGHRFHLKPESLMLESGFYLQDNDEYGGGLTIMPGSHKTTDNFINPRPEKSFLEKVKTKLAESSEEKDPYINPHKHQIYDVPSKAGDLVIFNFLTNHRATLPKVCKTDEVPYEKHKLAFFNAYSINNTSANEYFEYIKSRPEPFYKYLNGRKPNNEILKKAHDLDFIAL